MTKPSPNSSSSSSTNSISYRSFCGGVESMILQSIWPSHRGLDILLACLLTCLLACLPALFLTLLAGWLAGWLTDWLAGWLAGLACAHKGHISPQAHGFFLVSNFLARLAPSVRPNNEPPWRPSPRPRPSYPVVIISLALRNKRDVRSTAARPLLIAVSATWF